MKPYLYTLVNKEQLIEMMDTFYQCMNLPIQVLDENGQVLHSCGGTTTFCSLFKKKLPPNETCAKLHADASKIAMDLGGPYIFSCHANLNHIVMPLINQNALFGSILAGPFLMDEADSILIEDISKRYSYTPHELLELYDESKTLPVIPPAKMLLNLFKSKLRS